MSGARPEADLALYESLRRPAAAQVLALADRLTTLATMRSPVLRFVRNALLWLVDELPFMKRRVELNLSGLARAALARVPAAGATERVPARPALPNVAGSRLRTPAERPAR